MTSRVYADYNASAPLRPEALAAVETALALVGNPSSAHREGARLRRLIEAAREDVAMLLGRHPRDVAFTSGATEANATVVRGLLAPGDRLITTAIEHASILEGARQVAAMGVVVEWASVTENGEVDPTDICLGREADLASFGFANGEVGSILSEAVIDRVAAGVRWVHLDVTQAVGRVPLPARTDTILTLSAHKLGGLPGTGALVLPPDTPLRALIPGGAQERGRRAGTENVAGILAFGSVARVLRSAWEGEAQRVRRLRDDLWARIVAQVPGVRRNGPDLQRALPNTLNVTVPGISGDALLVRLDLAGVAASLGSACAAGSPEPSHVLRAMGRDEAAARAGLRLSLGWATTPADVVRIGDAIASIATTIVAGAAA